MRRFIAIAGLVLAAAGNASAQDREDMPVSAADRARIIDGVANKLADGYVFADKAAFIKEQLSSKKVRARYDTLQTASALTDALSRDLQAWSHDRHLKVLYSVPARPMPAAQGSATPAERAREFETAQARNFGFHQVERLTGNIGYLELGRFDAAQLAAPTAIAAMQFLANTDALIIDLRGNGGGHADMVAFLTSYFIDEQTKLGTLERRDPANTDQIWSAAYVPGQRYVGKPVYILTSNRTFSAAEGLTYDLKYFAHATVVGEKTRGGANPGGIQQIDEHYAVIVPMARMVHAVTGTNWDADGIAPDLAVAAADAKKTAHRAALEKLIAAQKDSPRIGIWQQAMSELFPVTQTSK